MNTSTYTSSPDYQFNHQKKKIFPHFPSSPCIPRDHHNRVIKPNSRWVEKIIRSSASRIKQLNAIPIFATITPMSIQTWNKHRLHAHRTSHLNHFHHYQNIQDTIEEATLAINTTIHSINSSNKVITLKLAQEIIYYRHGHLRTRYGKLPDGVHPNQKVLSSWTQTMKTIINRNTGTKSLNHTPPAPPTQTIIQPVQINPPSSPPSPPPVSDSDSEQGSPKRSWRNY